MTPILANCSASISELKKSPTALLVESNGAPIAILNHNKPTAYLIPSETYELMMECLEDYELAKIIEERGKSQAVTVSFKSMGDKWQQFFNTSSVFEDDFLANRENDIAQERDF